MYSTYRVFRPGCRHCGSAKPAKLRVFYPGTDIHQGARPSGPPEAGWIAPRSKISVAGKVVRVGVERVRRFWLTEHPVNAVHSSSHSPRSHIYCNRNGMVWFLGNLELLENVVQRDGMDPLWPAFSGLRSTD